jgi:ATP-dependent Lhr-like helicase
VAAGEGKLDVAAIEHVARALLNRYGVVFWRLLEREASGLPPWRELLRVYRRLESSGEIRGGRFVAGFTGEQFALPEAIGTLREVRRHPATNEWTAVSGVDPLNLAGILTPGPRLAALAGNRLLYRDGVPAASLSGDEVRFFEELDPATEWFARKVLVRRTGGAPTLVVETSDRQDAGQPDLESASGLG